jgi:O-antigen/teichoic acid export membrane protein
MILRQPARTRDHRMTHPLLTRVRPWIGKSFWAIMDQGLFAFSNFLLNLCLARWLAPESYGAFALAFTVFLFAGVLHSSIFTEPMLVFGSGKYRQSQQPYLSTLVRFHWTRAWPILALLIAAVSVAYWDNPARSSILFLAATCSTTLYQWLMRRACYLSQQPDLAASGGFLYLVTVLGGIATLHQTRTLDAIPALAVMAGASLLSGALIQFRLKRQRKLTSAGSSPDAEILRAHWDYGRWAIATGVIGWFSGNIAMVSLPWWHGNEATGAFRAGLNLILPVQQLLAAAGPLLIPLLVRSRDLPQYRRITLTFAILFSAAPLAWALALGGVGPWICDWLYDGRYAFNRPVLILLGLAAVFGSFGQVMAGALRAMELPNLAFRGYAASAVFSLILGLPLIALGGILGASASLMAALAVSTAIHLRMVWKRTANQARTPI